MEGINKIFCGADVKNTGICECFFDPKLITGAILVPRNKVFTSTELLDANVLATMNTAISTVKNSRIFPIQGLLALTDNSEDDTIQTFGYGSTVTVREGKYQWLFQFQNGGVNLSNALRTFNGLIGKYAVIFIESQNTLIGTSKIDVDGSYGLAGVPLEDLFTPKWKASDGSNVTVYGIRFAFQAPYINENIAFKKVAVGSLMLTEINGLEDITLELVEATGDEDATVRADTDCGSTDLFDLYADEFANEEAWIVKDADGNLRTITGVVANTGPKNWTLTSSTPFEDGDTIQLAAPTVLAVPPVSVVGYESNILTLAIGS
jgi:hypothetical protein